MSMMKVRRVLVAVIAVVLVLLLFACGTKPNPNPGPGPNNGDPVRPTPLADLPDYSSASQYYNVSDTYSSYGDIDVQTALLDARRTEQADKEDPSVPVKIFLGSDSTEIIKRMGKAALSKQEMIDTVAYLAGNSDASADVTAVDGAEWKKGEGWSFFDDVDYLENLRDLNDDTKNKSDTVKNKNSDNASWQQRKIMGKIFEIGMSGDTFARLAIEMILYSEEIANAEKVAAGGSYTSDANYDNFVKNEYSYDTLVYFKAFDEFYNNGQNRSKTVQLYGYYYLYDKGSYDSLTEAEFEKQLRYGHLSIFTDAEFLDYLSIERKVYANAYRYKADNNSNFYPKFYMQHFAFQSGIEKFDMEVYGIDTPTSAQSLTYSSEMRLAMSNGFKEQLVMSDWLYVYSMDETAMKAYNTANTNYENSRNEIQTTKDLREFEFNMEQMKIVNFILGKMTAAELTGTLKYQIRSYSGNMLRSIQSERKGSVLDILDASKLDDVTDAVEKSDLEYAGGRKLAWVAQIQNTYGDANITQQMKDAESHSWAGIHTEVKYVLDYDYTGNGTQKKEAFEDNLIKKNWSCGGTDKECKDKVGQYGHVNCTETYDTNHKISRFLNSHEKVFLYATGQVTIDLSSSATNGKQYTGEFTGSKAGTTYTVGREGNIYTTAWSKQGKASFGESYDSVSFESGLTLQEGLADANEKNFLVAGDKVKVASYTEGVLTYTYTFVGWFIDTQLKYMIDKDGEEIKYDAILYPGYTLVVTSAV